MYAHCTLTGPHRQYSHNVADTPGLQPTSSHSPTNRTTLKIFLQKYYGLSAYWAATSPAAYSHMAMPVITEEESRRKLKASSYTPLYDQDFSTFGKRAGKRALRQLQDMQESMPSGGDNVYDAPTPVDKSKLSLDWKQADRAEDGYEEVCRPKNNKPIRPRPLLSQVTGIHDEDFIISEISVLWAYFLLYIKNQNTSIMYQPKG